MDEIGNIHFYEDVTNHSKDITDLIEPGDYVNGLRITSKEGNILFISDIEHKILYEPIKTIVTKEQYAAIEYKIEAEEK